MIEGFRWKGQREKARAKQENKELIRFKKKFKKKKST